MQLVSVKSCARYKFVNRLVGATALGTLNTVITHQTYQLRIAYDEAESFKLKSYQMFNCPLLVSFEANLNN